MQGRIDRMKKIERKWYSRKAAAVTAVCILLLAGIMTACGSSEEASKEVAAKSASCTLEVRCDMALESGKLDASKRRILPEDGVLFQSQEVAFVEGDTVYDVLQREMKEHKIHMESAENPVYESQYIEGIGNLYEFDCGDLSGWIYKVNDSFPEIGCSEYEVREGDHIQWLYSCDLGKDVGKEGWKK